VVEKGKRKLQDVNNDVGRFAQVSVEVSAVLVFFSDRLVYG
jgi:hypothetical protein